MSPTPEGCAFLPMHAFRVITTSPSNKVSIIFFFFYIKERKSNLTFHVILNSDTKIHVYHAKKISNYKHNVCQLHYQLCSMKYKPTLSKMVISKKHQYMIDLSGSFHVVDLLEVRIQRPCEIATLKKLPKYMCLAHQPLLIFLFLSLVFNVGIFGGLNFPM